MKALVLVSMALGLCACGTNNNWPPNTPVPATPSTPTNISCNVYEVPAGSKIKLGLNTVSSKLTLAQTVSISSFDGSAVVSGLSVAYQVVCTANLNLVGGVYKFSDTSSATHRSVRINNSVYSALDGNGDTDKKTLAAGAYPIEVRMLVDLGASSELSLLGSMETSAKPLKFSAMALIDSSNYSQ